MTDRPTEQPQPEDQDRPPAPPEPAVAPPPATPPAAPAVPPAPRWSPSGRLLAVAAALAALVIGGTGGFGLGFLVGHHGLRGDHDRVVQLDLDRGERFGVPGGPRTWPRQWPDRPAEPESDSPSPSSL